MGSSLLRISGDEKKMAFSSQKYVCTHQELIVLEEVKVLCIELSMTFAMLSVNYKLSLTTWYKSVVQMELEEPTELSKRHTHEGERMQQVVITISFVGVCGC